MMTMGKKYPYLKTQHTPKILHLSNLHISCEIYEFLHGLETKTDGTWDEFSPLFDEYTNNCFIEILMYRPEELEQLERDKDMSEDFFQILRFATGTCGGLENDTLTLIVPCH